MSNKTTAILTFLVSTVIPFIQEIVDFIEMFRTGSYNREGSSTLKAMSMAMQDDLVNMQKRRHQQNQKLKNLYQNHTYCASRSVK